MKYLVLATFLSCSSAYALVQEYRGVQAYKQGDFKKAQQELQQSLINNPHDPQLLYNNGDVAYRLKEYDAASAYFKKAAQASVDKSPLQEQSLFNLGTTYVQQEKLREALQTFNDLLRNNPHHERALHNKKVVEERLREKEQQEQDSSQSQKKKDKSKKEDGQQSKREQDGQGKQEDQQESDQQEGQQEGQDGQEQQQSGSNKGAGKKQKQERSEHDDSSQGSAESEQEENNSDNKTTEKNNSKQRQQQQEREKLGQQEKAAADNQESSGQAQQKPQGQNQQDVGQQQKKNDGNGVDKNGAHKNLSGVEDKKKGNAADKKAQQNKEPLVAPAVEAQDSEEDKKQPEYQLLKAVDQAEEEVGKDLFKTMVKAKMKGQDGQKNW